MITVYRSRAPRADAPSQTSGDRLFDQSLRSILERPLPNSPSFPVWPSGSVGDSLVLTVSFGFVDSTAARVGVVRFAAQQRAVRLQPGTLRVDAPRGPGTLSAGDRRASVKYDVTAAGTVDMGSFEVLESSDPDLSRAIQDGLARARFDPAESNCRPIAQTVLQTFGP